MTTTEGHRLGPLRWVAALLAAVTFGVCVFYAYAFLVLTPAPGFNALDADWQVVTVDPSVAGRDLIRPGDQLLRIGDLAREQYLQDKLAVPFGGARPGDVVPIVRSRDGQVTTVEWLMPPVSGGERVSRLIVSTPAFAFFLVGFVIQLLLRPRNLQWLLLLSFCYLTAAWLALGIVSSSQVAGSSIGLHAVTWLLSATLLDLHFTFPRAIWQQRTRQTRPWLYVIACLAAGLELIGWLPRWAYELALLVAVLVSLVLLCYHMVSRASPGSRTTAGIMLFGVGLALGPGILLSVVPNLLQHDSNSALLSYFSLFAVPLLPLFYTYAIYKRHLGSLEFRANRWLSLYAFLVVYLTALVLILLVGQARLASSDEFLLYSLVTSAVFVACAPVARSAFQRWADRVAYGTRDIPENLVHMLANQIPTAHSREALSRLLAERITPSLFIRQSALYLFTNNSLDQVYASGLTPDQTSITPTQLARLLATTGRYRLGSAQPSATSPLEAEAPDWVRLAVPLQLEQSRLGIWLFGRRDPDDYYPQPDIELLSTLANQVALGLDNLRLFQGVQQRLAELQALFDVSESLATAGSLADILQAVVVRALVCAPSAAGAVIHRIEPDSGLLVPRAVAGDVSNQATLPPLYAANTVAGRAILERRLIYSPQVELDPTYGPESRASGSLVCIPLVVSNEVLGNLSVVSPQRRAFGDDDLHVLESLGHQAAVAIKKAQITDSLVETLAVVRQRSAELEASVARLKSTQLQLVQAVKLAAIGTLSAGLTHEINNPLSAIKMYAQNLKRSQQRGLLKDEMLVKNLTSIDTLADKISHVITHFRDFSRQSSNTFVKVDINQPLLSALDMFGEQLSARDITVTHSLAGNLPPAMADANQLEQVVVNLIANASDALADRPRRELRLSTLRVNNHLVMEVSDTGCGIAPDVLDHIFEPFYTTKEPGRGTGLGLAISRGILEDHHGRLEVDSTPGEGTTFRVLLPIEGGPIS